MRVLSSLLFASGGVLWSPPGELLIHRFLGSGFGAGPLVAAEETASITFLSSWKVELVDFDGVVTPYIWLGQCSLNNAANRAAFREPNKRCVDGDTRSNSCFLLRHLRVSPKPIKSGNIYEPKLASSSSSKEVVRFCQRLIYSTFIIRTPPCRTLVALSFHHLHSTAVIIPAFTIRSDSEDTKLT